MRTGLIFLSFLIGIVAFSGLAIADINIWQPWLLEIPGLYVIAPTPNQYFDMGGFFFYVSFDSDSISSAPVYIPNYYPENITFKIENITNVIASTSNFSGTIDGLLRDVRSLPFNITNFSAKTRGDYNLTVTIDDSLGNISKRTIRTLRFIEDPEALAHIIIKTNLTNMTTVNVNGSVSASFDFKFKNYTNGTMDIARYNSSPESAVIAGSALGKYIEVALEQNLTTNMQWAIVRIHYTDQDLIDNGIVTESNLKFYQFDEGSGTWIEVVGSGVDVVNNFVFMNVTHFSTYGVYEGLPAPTPIPTSGSVGGGGGSYLSVTNKNETNSTHIVIREILDCSSIGLPDGSTCNESWVYIPDRVEMKEVEKRVEVVKEAMPTWSYVVMGLMAAIILILLLKIFKGRQETPKK